MTAARPASAGPHRPAAAVRFISEVLRGVHVAPPPLLPDGRAVWEVSPAEWRARYEVATIWDDERVWLAKVDGPAHQRTGNRAVQIRAGLRRHLEPVDVVFRAAGITGCQTGAARMALARGIQQFDAPFWTWTDAQWAHVADTQRYHDKRTTGRSVTFALGYVLCDARGWRESKWISHATSLAAHVFGHATIAEPTARVSAKLRELGYRHDPRRGEAEDADDLPDRGTLQCLTLAMLAARSPRLEDLTPEVLGAVRIDESVPRDARVCAGAISTALLALGVHTSALGSPRKRADDVLNDPKMTAGIAPEWVAAVERWTRTSTRVGATREGNRRFLLQAGRWLAECHPAVRAPDDWTTELAAEYIAMIDRSKGGDHTAYASHLPRGTEGKPLRPRSKAARIEGVRRFLLDMRRWKLATLPHIDPANDLALPRSIRDLIGPDPRDIDSGIWVKLVWASLNLADDDIAGRRVRDHNGHYPPALIRAAAVLWTHAGLRSDETVRLRVGCVRDVPRDAWVGELDNADDITPEEVAQLACLLDIPPQKTGGAMTKAVGRVVADFVRAWEAVRPSHPAMLDRKTGELVQFLLVHRGRRVPNTILNDIVIPILCRKAGVPRADVSGRTITSHRGRASAATWYLNANMSIEEVQRWLGHRSPDMTRYHARRNPIQEIKAFAKAHRNTYLAEVLVDTEAPWADGPLRGKPRMLYPLGNGDYCGNPFYATCPHRVVCPGCDYHVPAGSQEGEALRTKGRYMRMLMEMPLSDDEKAAVAGDYEKQELLVSRLQHTPTPSGLTPEQIVERRRRTLPTAPRSGAADPRGQRPS